MGYWEEKKKYEELKNESIKNANMLPRAPLGLIANCTWCGSSLKFDKENNRYKWTNCQGLHLTWKGKILCEECAKKCKKCGQYFCPKHINNHKCIVKELNNDKIEHDCIYCKSTFVLEKKEIKELEKKGKINTKCPYCRRIQVCEE